MDKEQAQHDSQVSLADRDIDRFVDRLDKFLSSSLRKILKESLKGTPNAKRAAQALGGLQSALKGLGLNDQLASLGTVYGNQLKEIEKQLRTASNKDEILNDVDIDVTHQLIVFDTNVIANKVEAVNLDLSSAIMRQVITGESPDIDSLVDSSVPTLASQVATELRTATSAFSRSINQRKADELGLNYFLYTGPIDKITRPFCRSKVGKVFTREEISKWDNHQGLPASIYLGGYNCRHDLRPISEERAKQLGYGN